MEEKVRAYIKTINLNDYDLGGVEITDEDIMMIVEEIEAGTKLETAVEEYLLEVRRILDESLD